MSPMRLGYRDLGLDLVSIEDNHSYLPKKTPMVKENRDDGEEDYIKMLLEESLA
jgi:hypothetical protein